MITPLSNVGPAFLGLPTFWPVIVALVICGAIGFHRGWIRELATLGLILLSWLLVVLVGYGIMSLGNRIALMVQFTWSSGFDSGDPAALLRSLKAIPLIDPSHPEWFYGILFAIGVLAAYLGANRVGATGGIFSESILGALAGALNGYLISFVLLDFVQKTSQAGVRAGSVPSDWPVLPGGNLTTVAIVVVIGIVAIALSSKLRGSQSPMKAKRAGRAGG